MELKKQTDFLREFAEFSLTIPLKAAECFYEALTKAYFDDDFDTVAKLQVKLHAEMVASLETAGALLLSFSKWDEPGGVRRILLTYRNREVYDFLEELYKSPNPLEILCFPKKNDILEHYKNEYQENVNKYYNNEELSKSIRQIMDVYRNEIITKSYNKIKHGGIVIRNIEALDEEEKFGKTKVYIPLYDLEKNKITFVYFSVVGSEGMKLAEKYLQNVKMIVEITKVWCKFLAYCLEKELLLPSKYK